MLLKPKENTFLPVNEILFDDFFVEENKQMNLIAIFINVADIKLPIDQQLPFEQGMQGDDFLILNNGIILRFKDFGGDNYAWIKSFKAFSVLYKTNGETQCFALRPRSLLN